MTVYQDWLNNGTPHLLSSVISTPSSALNSSIRRQVEPDANLVSLNILYSWVPTIVKWQEEYQDEEESVTKCHFNTKASYV